MRGNGRLGGSSRGLLDVVLGRGVGLLCVIPVVAAVVPGGVCSSRNLEAPSVTTLGMSAGEAVLVTDTVGEGGGMEISDCVGSELLVLIGFNKSFFMRSPGLLGRTTAAIHPR